MTRLKARFENEGRKETSPSSLVKFVKLSVGLHIELLEIFLKVFSKFPHICSEPLRVELPKMLLEEISPLGLPPRPVTVTTRTITVLVGNPNLNLHFATVSG